jgi:hypothetical protein
MATWREMRPDLGAYAEALREIQTESWQAVAVRKLRANTLSEYEPAASGAAKRCDSWQGGGSAGTLEAIRART